MDYTDKMKSLNAKDLASLITNDPNCLTNLSQQELVDLTSKMNPYSKSVSAEQKPFLFSFVNFKMNYLKTMQALSMSMFLE